MATSRYHAGSSLLKSIIGLVTVFLLSLISLYLVATKLTGKFSVSWNRVVLQFPRDVEDLKRLVDDFTLVKEDHWWMVLLLFSLAYLFKQTFSIPGSAILNVFAGAIFGGMIGVPLVCVLSATGASSCFLLSKTFGQRLIEHYLKNKIEPVKMKIKGQPGASEFLILVSARLFPATPNWLLNMTAPHIGVDLTKFYFSVLIGLIPYNFICVQAGTLLQYMTDLQSLVDFKTFLSLSLISVTLIIIALCFKKFKTL